jgi:digeranylgeranylglycerophospholipid reductase
VRAEGAGAELRYPVGVTGVRGREVRLANGTTVEGQVVIGADGPLSTVGRSVGLVPERTMFRMITATVDGPLSDGIELYFGRDAPGGYGWSFPRTHDLNVGLGVPVLRPGASLGRLLEKFVARNHLRALRERTQWWVPVGPPPASLVRENVLLCGDAANLVMATNGGGIPTAMLSGWLAGTAAAHHVREGAPLGAYDTAWRAGLFDPLDRAARVWQWGDHFARYDPLLALGMRYIGSSGLDRMMRLRWPWRGGGSS